MATDDTTQIDAKPTKTFFVDMITRDIQLEQAILDLIDNSVDGAKRSRGDEKTYEGRSVELTFNASGFRLVDNCGGFDREIARNYAFRFGRPRSAAPTPGSIGQFGIGMKRALFKFGRHFIVKSATPTETWAVDVDVDAWESTEDWHFEWAEFGDDDLISCQRAGTDVLVDKLRANVAARFDTRGFQNLVTDLIKSKHRQFIAQGLTITVNGHHVSAFDIFMLSGDHLSPGLESFVLSDDGEQDVLVTIKTGLGQSSPKEAGWYVICNGRVVLEADRSEATGWHQAEADADRLLTPGFHNQYARFRGIISFDSTDSKRVPWTTTKNDIDRDSSIWLRSFPRMIEMMQPVLRFLNDLERDVDDNTREASPLLQVVTRANSIKSDVFTLRRSFSAPNRNDVQFAPRTAKIQYSKTIEEIDFLKEALGVSTAKAVGEKSFELTLKRQQV